MKMSQGYERTHETTASRPGGLKFVYETFILMVSVILHLPSRGMSKAEQEITCHLTECEKSNKLARATRGSRVTLAVTFVLLYSLRSAPGISEQKRECSQSIEDIEINNI